ncbi:unknown [Bacteroides sp. CAG:443]|nr:unknown [Bacteroides sp. CAG:443]
MVKAAVRPQRLELDRTVFLHDQCTQERSNSRYGQDSSQYLSPQIAQHARNQRHNEMQEQGSHCNRKYRINQDDTNNGSHQFLPVVAMVYYRCTRRIAVQQTTPANRYILVYHLIGRYGKTNHIRSQESGDNRNSYYDGIQEMTGYLQADTQ